MASSFVTAKANAILTAEFKTATVYGALLLADPGDAGSATCEVADCYCYTRKEITFGSDGNLRAISSTDDLTYDVATGGAWGEVTYLGISLCSTIGEAIDVAYGNLTASKTVGDGDQIKFSSGNITITIAAGA
jgi:hypothetical protein